MIRCLRVCFHNSGDFSEINWGELNLRWGEYWGEVGGNFFYDSLFTGLFSEFALFS